MTVTTIPIAGTFDIAKGRSSLRTHVAIHRWPPQFNARSSAALTALGELILSCSPSRVVIVRLEVIADGDEQGILLDMTLPLSGGDRLRLEQGLARIERAVDRLDIREFSDSIQLSAQVCVQEKMCIYQD
jgi:hypothetical protein